MRHYRKLSAWFVLVATGCVEPLVPVEDPGTADLPETSAVGVPGEASGPAPVEVETRPANNTPPEVAQLQAAVRGLGDHAMPEHTGVVRALRALADALVVVAAPRDDRQRAIRLAADQLAGTPADSELDADIVRTALEDALVTLAAGSPRPDADVAEYERAVIGFRAALERIDRERPLRTQHRAVQAAFAAALAALEIAVDVRDQRARTPRK